MIHEKREVNSVNFMLIRAFCLEALSRLQGREENLKQHKEGDAVWNFGRVRSLEFEGQSPGEEGAAWRKSSKICQKDPSSIMFNTNPRMKRVRLHEAG